LYLTFLFHLLELLFHDATLLSTLVLLLDALLKAKLLLLKCTSAVFQIALALFQQTSPLLEFSIIARLLLGELGHFVALDLAQLLALCLDLLPLLSHLLPETSDLGLVLLDALPFEGEQL